MTRRQGILRCPGCSLWRPWFSWKTRPNIDRECIKCGRRIRVQLDRKGSRGRKRKVDVREFPDHLPHHSLVKILRSFNKFERAGGRKRFLISGGSETEFTKASDLTRTIREISDPEWELIEKITETEVGESENEV